MSSTEDISRLLRRPGPLASPTFEPNGSPERLKELQQSRILLIGAGGLGCELLKNLTLSGFLNIDVIDLDTIDPTNLNRQFLFRPKDINRPKAEVAAEFVNKRVKGANITAHFCRIEEKDDDFYRQFKVIICGLDSINARRWINSKVFSLIQYDDDGNPDFSTIIPIIDGGTEGFKGQARVITPTLSSCFECSLDLFPPQVNFPLCTLAHTPRQPEHCIQWASILQWPAIKPFADADGNNPKIDTDNPKHMDWVYHLAKKRAEEYKIPGVTLKLTQGVVKNIIPAISSTNAIIAASTASEVFKFLTDTSLLLDNYMSYNGAHGVATNTFQLDRKEDCAVCGSQPQVIYINGDWKLEQFLEWLAKEPTFQLKKPSIATADKNLFLQGAAIKSLEEHLKPNLHKTLRELFNSGDNLSITDPLLQGNPINVIANFN